MAYKVVICIFFLLNLIFIVISMGHNVKNIIFLLVLGIWGGCQCHQSHDKSSQAGGRVVMHLWNECDMLNPYSFTTTNSKYVIDYLFQPLLRKDYKTLELTPVLARQLPEVKKNEQGHLLITYHLRTAARWDNGRPITVDDVAFSLKVIKNPAVEANRIRPYYEFIDSIIRYPGQPKKFTFYARQPYMFPKAYSGRLRVIPYHVYDPDSLLYPYTVAQIDRLKQSVPLPAPLKQFAQQFNGEKYKRDPSYIKGSGAYELVRWKSNITTNIVLQRKENWWGDQVETPNMFFEAYPQEIVFRSFSKQQQVVEDLKQGEYDVVHEMPAIRFEQLKYSKKVDQQYQTFAPVKFETEVIGMHTRSPKLNNIKIRQALAHLVDVPKLIRSVEKGYARRQLGPVNPEHKAYYNDTLTPYYYNWQKARSLLREAGWKDTDGDGTVDKIIGNQRREMRLEFLYTSNDRARRTVGAILQKEAKKVGINIILQPMEITNLLDQVKNKNFDLFCLSFSGQGILEDPKQLWHTKSYAKGLNFTGFGDAMTDSLITAIRTTVKRDKRQHLYCRLQEIIHQRLPYIFLYAPQERLMIKQKYSNLHISSLPPSCWLAGFKTASPDSAERHR